MQDKRNVMCFFISSFISPFSPLSLFSFYYTGLHPAEVLPKNKGGRRRAGVPTRNAAR